MKSAAAVMVTRGHRSVKAARQAGRGRWTAGMAGCQSLSYFIAKRTKVQVQKRIISANSKHGRELQIADCKLKRKLQIANRFRKFEI